MQKITPCLWFDHQAEEAAQFYVSVFRNARIKATTHYNEAAAEVSGMAAGSVLTVSFQLEGEEFMAMNGGPVFQFTPAVSLMVYCITQPEVDHLWEKLSEGGEPGQCGWLKDRYGVSWQVVPTALERMLQDRDPMKVDRVMKALLPMTKIDIRTLELAYKG